ncbi:hypothetical protein HCJ94_29150 [Micromonospora sp. HSS6-12]|uniref:Oxidoreductase FAD/NAD(P)-binding domain-containing protein n=1 Tax=Micromonospora thermarum TaxID=2720024 RepID=A0ABX0ZDA8_9ACTN|nr:hypothetical protein [Micromonospora thermarum]
MINRARPRGGRQGRGSGALRVSRSGAVWSSRRTPSSTARKAAWARRSSPRRRQPATSGHADSGAPHWRITVKRVRGTAGTPDGMVSTFLHERVSAGDTLRLSPPFGEVSAIGDAGPLLLVSAGIGLTPAMAALEHLAATEPEREVVLVHADQAAAAHARRAELPGLQDRLPNLSVRLWYEDAADGELTGLTAEVATGLVDPNLIPLSPEAHVHLCGPAPFMSRVRGGLLRRGVPSDRIAYEVFGPGMLPD